MQVTLKAIDTTTGINVTYDLEGSETTSYFTGMADVQARVAQAITLSPEQVFFLALASAIAQDPTLTNTAVLKTYTVLSPSVSS